MWYVCKGGCWRLCETKCQHTATGLLLPPIQLHILLISVPPGRPSLLEGRGHEPCTSLLEVAYSSEGLIQPLRLAHSALIALIRDLGVVTNNMEPLQY